MSVGLNVESASLRYGLVVAGAPKVPGYGDWNLRSDYIAFLRRASKSMERSVAETTNQKDRQLQLKGRRLADMFAGPH